MAIEERVGATALTVTAVEADLPELEEVMVAVPGATPVMRPVALTEATDAALELKVEVAVTSPWVPSLKVAVAVSCRVAPTVSDRLVGDTLTPVKVTGVSLELEHAESRRTGSNRREATDQRFLEVITHAPGDEVLEARRRWMGRAPETLRRTRLDFVCLPNKLTMC
jgi:hypothetical protein